jgi:hypothetical protein
VRTVSRLADEVVCLPLVVAPGLRDSCLYEDSVDIYVKRPSNHDHDTRAQREGSGSVYSR